MKKSIGLALGGGGPRGIAHVGVIKTLLKNKIPIDYIAGTSAGAWVGAFYAEHKDVVALEEATVGFKGEKIKSLFEPTLKGGLVKGNKVKSFLNVWLGDILFKDLEIPLSIVTTDLVSGKQVVINSGSVVPALQASMSIPLLFKPVEINKRLLVDGGLVNPLPNDVVRQMGADIVIAVNLDAYLLEGFNKKDYSSLVKTGLQSYDIMRYNLSKHLIDDADVVIEPKFDGSRKLWADYFIKGHGAELVDVGVEATLKIMKDIKALL